MNKKPTYKFYVNDQEGNQIDMDTLSKSEKERIGKWAYQTMVSALGYEKSKDQKAAVH